MKASTKRAIEALTAQASGLLSKFEDLLTGEQEYLDELDPDSQKIDDQEEVVSTLEEVIAGMEDVISSLESFI